MELGGSRLEDKPGAGGAGRGYGSVEGECAGDVAFGEIGARQVALGVGVVWFERYRALPQADGNRLVSEQRKGAGRQLEAPRIVVAQLSKANPGALSGEVVR